MGQRGRQGAGWLGWARSCTSYCDCMRPFKPAPGMCRLVCRCSVSHRIGLPGIWYMADRPGRSALMYMAH